MRILVLDDYRSHGESLAELLHSRGHEALYAANYQNAEWLLELFPFDFAILDFDMPDLSGPAVAARLARRSPPVRSAIMSAQPLTAPRRDELGGLRFLHKPFALARLLELLSEVEREVKSR